MEPRVAFAPSEYSPVADTIDDEYSFVLTRSAPGVLQHRRPDTCVPSARRQEELLMIHPDDAAAYGIRATSWCASAHVAAR